MTIPLNAHPRKIQFSSNHRSSIFLRVRHRRADFDQRAGKIVPYRLVDR